MRTRRAVVVLLVTLAVIGSGCEMPEDGDEGGSAEVSGDGNGRDQDVNARSRDAEFPSSPSVAIDWQSTVVDVVPTSRFQDPPGGPDTGKVETVLALEEEPDDETRRFLEELDGVTTEFDGRLVRMTYTIDVEEEGDNEYRFEIAAPVEFAELEKNDDVSVVALLPRNAEGYENVPTYDVRLEGLTEETPEDDVEVLDADEAPGRRITLGLYARQDPKLGAIFSYIGL